MVIVSNEVLHNMELRSGRVYGTFFIDEILDSLSALNDDKIARTKLHIHSGKLFSQAWYHFDVPSNV